MYALTGIEVMHQGAACAVVVEHLHMASLPKPKIQLAPGMKLDKAQRKKIEAGLETPLGQMFRQKVGHALNGYFLMGRRLKLWKTENGVTSFGSPQAFIKDAIDEEERKQREQIASGMEKAIENWKGE